MQVQGVDIERLLQRQRSVVAVDDRSHASALQAALGNHPPTPDLTPFIFRPLLQVLPPPPEPPCLMCKRMPAEFLFLATWKDHWIISCVSAVQMLYCA